MLDMPGGARANDPDAARCSQPSQGPARSFGGGRMAGVPHALDIPYRTLNPGADMQAVPAKEARPDRG